MRNRERIGLGAITVISVAIGVHVYIWCKMQCGRSLAVQQSEQEEDTVWHPTPRPTPTSVHRYI